MRISSSDVNAFLRCRRLWDYTSDNRRRLTPVAPTAPLLLGSGIHEALERFYRDTPTPDVVEVFREWYADQLTEYALNDVRYDEERFAALGELGEGMLKGYLAEYGATPQEDCHGLKVLATEQQFAVAIPGTEEGTLVGRLDGLCRDANGCTWIFETKTYTDKPRLFTHIFQQVAYVWAAQQLSNAGNEQFERVGVPRGTRIYGVLYNGLRKKLPGPRVSVPLFWREWCGRSRQELRLFEDTLRSVYRDMSRPDVLLYPSMTQDCSWCGFRDPCGAALLGEDEDWILRMNYVRQPSRGEVYDEPAPKQGDETSGEVDSK